MILFKKKNPLDQLLQRMREREEKRFLIFWNRGLGDLALGLYAIIFRIRESIPDASITFLTRVDLKDGFSLLPGVTAICCPSWRRSFPVDCEKSLKEAGLLREDFDQIIEWPDPTKWCRWQLGALTPRLFWDPTWDVATCEKESIAVHVQTETLYGYEKNWPASYFHTLFEQIVGKKGASLILLGKQSDLQFQQKGVNDLRGKTSLFEMLSLIKNQCHTLIAPDSGILSLIYYLDVAFPLKLISLWADPCQGVLKQNVTSPNPLLIHRPLIGQAGNIKNISIQDVLSEC